MRVISVIWVLLVVIAIAVTGFNAYRIWDIYSEDEHEHDENCDHEHNFEVFPIEFTGVNIGSYSENIQSTFYAANSRNHQISMNTICKNTYNDDVYWYSETDNTVYKTSDGITESLFEGRAIGLIFYNDALFFISPEDSMSGQIWKFDFSVNKLTQFSDISASTICILNNQFYCTQMNYDGTILQYELSLNGSSKEVGYIYCGAYKNYYLAYQQGIGYLPILCLIDFDKGDIIPLITNNIYISEQSVYKETLYYRYFYGVDETDENIGNLCSLNLSTGESKVYNVEELFGHSHELSYNFVNDKLYLMSGTMIVEIDLETDEIIVEEYQGFRCNGTDLLLAQNSFYSDGRSIYLVVKDSDDSSELVSFNDFASLYNLLS